MLTHLMFFYIIVYRKMKIKSADKKNTSDKREVILDALNKSIEIFSLNKEGSFDEVMTNGIRPFADAVGLDRVVFYRVMDIEGSKHFGQIYRWDKSEGGLMSLAEELKILPNIPVLEHWISITAKGECVRIRESDYNEAQAAFLKVYGIKSILMKPIFTHGDLWGTVTFQDHANDRYFDEDCSDLLHSAAHIFSNAIIRAETGRSAEDAIKTLKRREKIEAALNRAAIMFLSQNEKTFEATMTAGIKEIANSLDLDRFSIWRNFLVGDVIHVSQIYRWDRESGGTTMPTKGLENVTYAQLAPRWEKLLASGETINSPARLLPEAEMLKTFGCVTAFVTPIFINNNFWGFALLEDRHNERFFEADSVEIMRSAAFLCANTVMRADMEDELASANEFNQAILNASPVGFTVFAEDLRVIDCSDITLKTLGTTKKYYLEHFPEFSPVYQSDGIKSADKAVEIMKRAFKGEKLVLEWDNCSAMGEIIPYEVTLLRATYKGKNVVLGYQYDLRSIRKMTESIRVQGELLKMRLEQQELISELSRGFISSGDSQSLVNEAVAKMGRYHGVTLVFVFTIDYDHKNTQLAYHWTADSSPPRTAIANLYEYIMNIFPLTLPDCATLPIVACDDTSLNSEKVFQALYAVGIKAIISAPLYVDGRLWGVLCVEQSSIRKWTENEKGFIAMAARTIAGIIMRDIYTLKLKEALNKAMEASKAKSEFLSNMSHEMRTPLNAITGMTTIGKNAKDVERKDYTLDKIQDASNHLLGVINDVLDMSKIEANMLELSPVEFNFEKMLQKVAAVVNFRVDEKQQNLSMHIDSKIPKTLIADDQRLSQVVTNLLSNAVKFTPEKGSITLEARCIEEKNNYCTIQISVIDTGIGISEEQQKRLFNPFQQAEAGTTRKYGGTGLGLAISKSIVELMGGKIWVKSEPDKGSTFNFSIKMKCSEAKECIEQEEEKKKETTENINGIFAGRRILLVEDMEINREVVLALLESTKLEIDCAENGKEAVRMFSLMPERYGLIFMDIQMPEMDGYEAARRIRAIENEHGASNKSMEFPKDRDVSTSFAEGASNKSMEFPKETPKQLLEFPRGIPIIAMTANVFKEDIEKCINAGMDDHIGKPIDFEEVLEKLRYYLKG